MTLQTSVPNPLNAHIAQAIVEAGGWLPFDAFMALALFEPRWGYYAHGSGKLGRMPNADGHLGQPGQSGDADPAHRATPPRQVATSDFVTAPEMTVVFGQTLALQIREALVQTQTDEIWEFGAGSGALAEQLLHALRASGTQVARYTIVDISGSLRARQQERLCAFAGQVRWVSELPEQLRGVVVGNEVLDAMPVQLLARLNGQWFERGVVRALRGELAWGDRPTLLRPPFEVEGSHDYVTEIHPQAEAFIRTVAQRLTQGAAYFIDYGFPEREFYHPQRHMGTVMCHRAHRADADPLADVGHKDITAHVNFTGVALAGQDAGLNVLGYTSQGRFLLNCGLLAVMQTASLADRIHAQKLVMEHEMGELFKVIGFCKGEAWSTLGFAQGDRTHTL